MRCLTFDEKVYNFENVIATTNSIIVNLPEPVVKSGCKKYNLPTTIYTIFVSHCLDNNLNKPEEFNVQTFERYNEIQNLTPFTEYKLKFTLSNFYFDQLSINPFDSNVTRIKTNLGKLNVPENISVLALTPIIAVVYWMPSKKLNCVIVTYEVHWKLVNDKQQENKQIINVPKRVADGRFFTKINLSLPVQDYLIYVRVYPSNFSDFYNESLSKIDHIYSEPNNITMSEANTNSMDISWISNVNLTVFLTLEYKEVATEKWQTTNNFKMNYNKEVIYHIENLQSGTLYKFRLILRYPEYEETFTWPTDERFIFSTRVLREKDIVTFVLLKNMTNTNNNSFYYSLSGNKQEDEKLLEPIRYNLQIPGMQITAKLIQTFNYWLKISPDRLKAIEEIVIMLHNSGNIIDDIQDNSILRKGSPVTHSVFGIASSLSAAAYILFIALERVINLQHPAAPKVCIEQLLELQRGQGIEIYWRDNFICPSEEDYKAMAIKKIGCLFFLPIRLMDLFSTYEEDLSPLLTFLSLYYQIRDDYCNLCLSDYTENSYCDDLTEGKFSFPVIHALKTNPDDKQIMNILKQRTKDIEIKRHCIKLLEKFGSLKYTRSVLEELDLKVRAEIDRLGGNPFLIKILDELKNWDSKEAT